MNKIANTVRAAFALFLLGLGLYAGIDSLVAHELSGRGLSSCGSAENPCTLEPLKVTLEKPAHRLVTTTAADAGTARVLGAAPVAPAAARTETAES